MKSCLIKILILHIHMLVLVGINYEDRAKQSRNLGMGLRGS